MTIEQAKKRLDEVYSYALEYGCLSNDLVADCLFKVHCEARLETDRCEYVSPYISKVNVDWRTDTQSIIDCCADGDYLDDGCTRNYLCHAHKCAAAVVQGDKQ